MKKLKQLDLMENEFLHSPFFPEEIRENDGVSVQIYRDEKWFDYRVWRYSPFGIEVLANQSDNFKVNDEYQIKLKFLEDELLFDSIKVSIVHNDNQQSIVGFRTFRKDDLQKNDEERRKAVRWSCPVDLLPTGTAPNPVKFNDHIIFRVEDISSGGMRLVTSMRNRLLYPGQFLESSISLPLVGNVNVILKVRFVDVLDRDGKQYLTLGVSFVKADAFLLSCLAEYLLHFGKNVSSQTLKNDGFHVKSDFKTFDFSYVKDKWEYEQVLELRKKAYIAASKVDQSIQSHEFADEFDSRARILIVRKNNEIVGSVRVMFHKDFSDSILARNRAFIDDKNITSDNSVEASRLCVDPKFQGFEVALNLLSHFTLTAIKAGKRYIYGGASDRMVDFYRRAGWKISTNTYSSESLRGIIHNVVYVDLHNVVLGKGITPVVWNKVYKQMFYYLLERELVHPSKVDMLRIRFFSMFS